MTELTLSWVELAKLRTGGTKLVAPAIANDLDWLKVRRLVIEITANAQKWFSLIPEGTKPDYLAIHVYTTTFDSFKAKVEEYYHTFGLPIIVTEFAMTVRWPHGCVVNVAELRRKRSPTPKPAAGARLHGSNYSMA